MIPHHRALAYRLLAMLVLATVAVGGMLPATGRVHAGHARAASDTLTIGWDIETKTLDPVNNPQNPDIWVDVNIYDQLTKVSKDGGSLLPNLATSWNISKDSKVYTFHLRPNVLFHDGTKLTAADVKFDLDRARDPKQSWSWTLTAVKTVDVVDPLTIKITLKHPWAPLLSDLSLFDTGIYPMAYFKKVGASGLSAHPIGSGPYMFVQWQKGQFIRLKKNPNYYQASQYPMQGLEYDLITDSNTRLLKVESGELDVNYQLAPNLITQVKNSQNAHVEINPSTYTVYLIANEMVKPFADVKVRQAISHAIDRQAMVKILTQGYGSPANTFLPKGAIDYDASIPVPKYDLTLAKKLLSESSAPHGFTMTYEIGSGNITDNQTAVLFQKEMAPLGITVNIKPMDRTTLFQNQLVGKYNFSNSGWTNDIPDPDELVSWAVDYTLTSKSFLTWYDNPKMISLSQKAEQTTDEGTRKQLYYQIQQIWANDQHFWALYYLPYINAVSNHVHGFSENPLGYFNTQGVTKS